MLISVNYEILTANQNPHLQHTPTIYIYDILCGSHDGEVSEET